MNLPTITIVTPSFNQREYLEVCIDSVLTQNYPHLEYIIVDGGSTDGSVEVIKKYAKYLAHWESGPDDGQYHAINKGFDRSTGEIMAWLNSDDKYHSASLCLVALLFSTFHEVEWIMGRPTVWDVKGNLLHVASSLPRWTRKQYLRGKFGPPHIQQESTFWRRSLWEKAGGYLSTNFALAGDMELWARFFRHASLYTFGTLLGGFRVHGNQRSQQFAKTYEGEAHEIVAREKVVFRNETGSRLVPVPHPIHLEHLMNRAKEALTPENFSFFTYSRKSHFNVFGDNDVSLYGKKVDPQKADLKVYQDLLLYTFIVQNIPQGSTLLEVGGGNSRVLRACHDRYECWNIDKCEGIGNGPLAIKDTGCKLVKDYIGEFSRELPDNYFDFVFSISALEHVDEDPALLEKICQDIHRVLKPGGYSLHSLDSVLQTDTTWCHSLIPFMVNSGFTMNPFVPSWEVRHDPDLYCMTEDSYNSFWKATTGKTYKEFGRPVAYNILWQKNSKPYAHQCETSKGGEEVRARLMILQDQEQELAIALHRCSMESILRACEIRAENYQDQAYKVTAIVASYNSQEFMRECLEDLTRQTIGDDLEIIVLDAASPEKERSVVADFQKDHTNIRYLRTPKRIGRSTAWNLMIEMAKGRYITAFNTNDRLRKEAYQILAEVLDKQQDVTLVYGDTLVTKVAHENFENNSAHDASRWPPYSYEKLLKPFQVGPHPMWRKDIHRKIGQFDDNFVALGDQEFWCRMAGQHTLLHIPEVTGLTWINEESISANKELSSKELRRLHRMYTPFWKRLQRRVWNKLLRVH